VTPRNSSGVRLQRLLALLSWVAAQPDGAGIDELCQRFEVAQDRLVDDLQLAMMIGADLPGYTDMPFEVIIEDGRVWVRLFSFRRPLRLTPGEGLALLAAGQAVLDQPGADAEGPLARGLDKLADLLGVEPEEVLDVDLATPRGPVAEVLESGLAQRRQVRLRYYGYARDAVSERVVNPWNLFVDQGAWYLSAWCGDAEGERVFRVDRIQAAELLEPTFEPPKGPPTTAVRIDAADSPRVVIDLSPAARWVLESFPVADVEEVADGAVRVTLVVTGRAWLERLLLRLGPDARVVEIDPRLGADPAADAARRVLARYR